MASSAPPGPEPRRDSRVGLMLADRYRIDALVDQGAMGRVYMGEHVLMKKRVAIKVLHRELTVVPEFVARFEREAMAAANINNAHVVAATDFGKLPDGAVFLVLEYVEGRNLRDEVVLGPLPLARSLHITRQIALALRSAHALGIVHRDLKPENVMLVEREGDPDFVKVLDFGIAKVPIGEVGANDGPSSKPITKAGMVFGTPEYMPPEQALGQNVDARADLYSLGVMTFEMLAGCRPFATGNAISILGQQMSEGPPSVSARAPGVTIPPSVERFVQKLLERDPTKRFQSADAVLAVIDEQLGYAPGHERIPTLLTGSLIAADDGFPTDPPDGAGLHPDHLPTNRMAIPGESRSLGRWVEENRHRLPRALRSVPAPILLSVPLALLGVVGGFTLVALFSSAPKEAPASAASTSASAGVLLGTPSASGGVAGAAPITATSTELSRAVREGRESLARLRAKYPKDPAILLAETGVLLQEKDSVGAVAAIGDALALDGRLKDDARISSALWVAAQNKKSGPAAFELLKGPMGDRGASILHDLTTTAGVRDAVRAEARRALGEIQSRK